MTRIASTALALIFVAVPALAQDSTSSEGTTDSGQLIVEEPATDTGQSGTSPDTESTEAGGMAGDPAQDSTSADGGSDSPAESADPNTEDGMVTDAQPRQDAASDTEPSAAAAETEPARNLIRVTSLLDGAVYASESDGGVTGQVGEPLLEVPAEWSEIGEIEDIALNAEGMLRGVVVEVGGFLGIGESTVLVPAEMLRSIRVGSEVYFMTTMSEEQLRDLPEIDDTMWE